MHVERAAWTINEKQVSIMHASIPSSSKTIDAVRDGDKRFVLCDMNEDRLVRTGREIIDACQMNISIEVWIKEVRQMVDFARTWTGSRADRIVACYFEPRRARLNLYFVPVGDRFNFDLADELTELNQELVRNFNVGHVETHQIPMSEVDRFIEAQPGRSIYAEDDATSRTVAP